LLRPVWQRLTWFWHLSPCLLLFFAAVVDGSVKPSASAAPLRARREPRRETACAVRRVRESKVGSLMHCSITETDLPSSPVSSGDG
jgi:hypothetical protein